MIEFKVIIVEDVPLELKGTEGILKSDVQKPRLLELQRMKWNIGG